MVGPNVSMCGRRGDRGDPHPSENPFFGKFEKGTATFYVLEKICGRKRVVFDQE